MVVKVCLLFVDILIFFAVLTTAHLALAQEQNLPNLSPASFPSCLSDPTESHDEKRQLDLPNGTIIFSSNPAPYGMEAGYTDNVDDEISSEPIEMILQEKPAFLNVPTFHDQIFNSELSNEFIFRYQQQFGATEQEQNYFLTSQQGYYNSPTGPLATAQDDARRQFAEYMLRRLAEFHTENMMKTDPGLRKIYDVKQAVSNVKLEIDPSTKADMTYSFVGNFMKTTITNPFVMTYLTVSMDPAALTPSAPHEIYLMESKPVTPTITTQAGYTFYDRAMRFMVSKALTPTMSTNISESFHVACSTITGSNEALTMLGFSLLFQ